MTENQRKRLYFPAWQRAFAANWTWARGRLTRHAAPTIWTDQVGSLADGYAAATFRAATPDDLRHAANALALSRAAEWRGEAPKERPGSTKDFTDRYDLSLGLFVVLCGLLEDPDTLGSFSPPAGRLAWDDPGLVVRAYILGAMERRVRWAYLVTLCRERWGVESPEDLRVPDLQSLWRTLGQRPNAWVDGTAPRAAQPF